MDKREMRVPKDADRDFVAGALVIEEGRILLIDHHKYAIWLPPGGHVEPGETPDETAKRETFEETGLKVELLEESEDISEKQYNGLPRPFNVNLHRVEKGHWHLDFLYRARIVEEKEATHGHEHNGIEWFSIEMLQDESYDIPEYVRKAGLKAIREKLL